MKDNRLKSAALALILFSAFLVSCAQKSELTGMVPESAAFFAQVTDLDTLFTNADAFVKEIGSQAVLDNKSVREFVDAQLKDSFEDISLSLLDPRKPLGLAMILPSMNESDPIVIMYVPLKNAKEDFAKVQEAFSEEGATVAQAGSYAVVHNSPDELKFPPEKPLDISGLAKYKKGSLSFLVNVKGIMGQYGAMLDAGIKEGLEELESSGGLDDGQSEALLQKVGALLVDGVKQAELFDGSLFLAKDGLELYSSMTFAKDTGLARFAAALGSARGTASFAKYLPRDHFLSLSMNMSESAQKLCTDFMMDLLKDVPGYTAEEIAFMRGNAEKQLAVAGTKSSMGMDFAVDMERIGELDSADTEDPGEIADMLFGAFTFKIAAAYSAKNGAAMLDQFKASYNDPAFKTMMNRSVEASGMGMSFAFSDAKDGDFPYSLMKLNMEVADEDMLGLDEETASAVFSRLSDKIPFYLASTKDRMFMTVGDGGLEDIKSLAAKGAHPEDMSKDASYAAFAKLAGDDGQLLMRVSTGRILALASMASGAVSGDFSSFEMPAESSTGLWAMVRARGNSIQSVGYWGAKEIGAVVQQIMTLATSFMSYGMSDMSGDYGEDYWEGMEGGEEVFSGD